jgi:hypothetical protein
MKFICAILLLLVISIPATASSFIEVSSGVQIEPASSLSAYALWNTTSLKTVDLGSVTVDFRSFDPEAGIRRGRWFACGFVMIGNGDLAMRPVAFRVWAAEACSFGVPASSGPGPNGESTLSLPLNAASSVLIKVSPELRVSIGGKVVGQVRVEGHRR